MTESFANRSTFRSSLYWLPLAGLALSALACADHVVVGDAKPEPEQQVDKPVDEPVTEPVDEPVTEPVDEPQEPAGEAGSTSTDPPEPDCSEKDAAARAPYEAWEATENDFGVLAGKTLSGYIEGGPDLLLTIAADHSATLVVGEPPPAPEKDQSYLCGDGVDDLYNTCEVAYSNPPVSGGTYVLHGATLENNRLKIPLQQFVPWDAWCALQTPVLQEECFFTTISNDGFGWSRQACSLGDHAVDCGWLQLAGSGICSCTSSECFAAMAGEGDLLDARLNDTEDEVSGSFKGATVYLFAEED